MRQSEPSPGSGLSPLSPWGKIYIMTNPAVLIRYTLRGVILSFPCPHPSPPPLGEGAEFLPQRGEDRRGEKAQMVAVQSIPPCQNSCRVGGVFINTLILKNELQRRRGTESLGLYSSLRLCASAVSLPGFKIVGEDP